MEFNIVSKEKNPFLKMEEIKFEISDVTKTPTKKEVKEQIAALTNSKEELIAIKKIDQQFGSHTAFGHARVYESKELMEKTEPKYILERNFGKKETSETKQKGPAQKTDKK